jgi:hypothetical protein
MRLNWVHNVNFQGLWSVEVRRSTLGCLIGENNPSKSSVLRGFVLAVSRSGEISLVLHYDPAVPVEFRLTLSGAASDHLLRFAEEHRARIAELIVDDGSS